MSRGGEKGPGDAGARGRGEGGLVPPYVVWACSAVFFWSISFRFVLYNLMPVIATDLELSDAMAGIVLSALFLGYAAGSWFAGWLPGSRRSRILWGTVATLPAMAAAALSRDLALLMVAVTGAGFGAGVYLPLGIAMIVEAGGRHRRARYLSTQEVAAGLASFGGSAFVAVILFWMDWSSALLLWTVVGVAAVLVFSRVRDEPGDERAAGGAQTVPLSVALVSSVLVYAATTLLLAGLIAVLPLIMVRAWGVELASAAAVIGYSRLAGLAGVLVAGFRGDRWGHRRMLYGFQALSLLGIVAMPGGFGPVFTLGLIAVTAGSTGMITLLPVVIASTFSPQERERVLATASGVGGFLGMVVSPALFGLMLEAGLVTGPLVASAVTTALAILVTGRIRK
jgi:MFS family permease